MSDEQIPPALSLRPRKKPAENETVAESSSAAAGKPKLSLKPKAKPVEVSAEAKPTLSLKPKPAPSEMPPVESPAGVESTQTRAKPKLSIQSDEPSESEAVEDAPIPATPPEAETAEPEPPVVEHRDESNPALDPAVLAALKKAKTVKPKLKLNISKPAEATPAAEAKEAPAAPSPSAPPPPVNQLPPPDQPAPPDFPPPEGLKTPADLPPPLPVVTDEEGRSTSNPPIPPSDEEYDEDEYEDEDDESEAPARKRLRPEQRPVFKIVVVIIVLALLGAIGAGGYMVYNLMFGVEEFIPPERPDPLPRVITPTEPAPVEPSGPNSVAGKLIEKAQNAAAAHGEVTDAVNEVTSEPAEPVVEILEPTVVVAEPTPAAPTGPIVIEPSSAFRGWVSNAVISSVREGSSPRAYINNIFVRQGDTLDHGLGIVFDRVDAERNLVIFKDATGAIVGKRY